MKDEKRSFKNSGSMIGVGTAIGAAVFAATGEATWIAVGVAIGAALSWRKQKNNYYLLVSPPSSFTRKARFILISL